MRKKHLCHLSKRAVCAALVTIMSLSSVLTGCGSQTIIGQALSEDAYEKSMAASNETESTSNKPDGQADGVKLGVTTKSSSSLNDGITGNNGYASLSDSVYDIYSDEVLSTKIGTVKGDSTDYVTVAPGTYYLKETKASTGYYVDTEVHKVEITEDKFVEILSEPISCKSSVLSQICITDRNSAGTAAGNVKDLSGILFDVCYYKGIYSVSEPLPSEVQPDESAVFKTDKNGCVILDKEHLSDEQTWKYTGDDDSLIIPLGTVLIKEKSVTNGLKLNESSTLFTITDTSDKADLNITKNTWKPEITVITGENAKVDGSNAYVVYKNDVIKGGVSVWKADADLNQSISQGNALLDGAEFTIYNRSEAPVSYKGNIYEKDAAIGTITSLYDKAADAYVAATDTCALEYGTYEIKETKASNGYNVSDWSKTFTINEDGQMFEYKQTGDEWCAGNVIRGGVTFGVVYRESKQYKNTDVSKIEGMKFQIVNESKNPVIVDDKSYAKDEVIMELVMSKMDGNDEVIIGAATKKDALPYGTYEIRKSDDKTCVKTFTIRTNGEMCYFTDENEKDSGMFVAYAVNANTFKKELAADTKQSIYECIDIKELEDNMLYKLEGAVYYIDSDGNTKPVLNSEGKEVTMTIENPENDEVMIFEDIDASKLGGMDIVVYQTLYWRMNETDEWMAAYKWHNNTDEDQMLHVPKISTELVASNGIHNIPIGKEIKLTDKVSYENLTPGQEYTVKGTLRIRRDSKVKDGADGYSAVDCGDIKGIEASVKFTPKEKNGSVDVVFTFDASKLKGLTVVAFERLYTDTDYKVPDKWASFFESDDIKTDSGKDILIAAHNEIADTAQAVGFTNIKSTTLTAKDGTHTASTGGKVVLTDVVSYEGLIPGMTYDITGTLNVKNKKNALVTVKNKFTPTTVSGTTTVKFTVNTDKIDVSGKNIVAFETISYNKIELASHKNIDDKSQTVYFKPDTTKNVCGCSDALCKYRNVKDKCKKEGCCDGAGCCNSCNDCKTKTTTTNNTTTKTSTKDTTTKNNTTKNSDSKTSDSKADNKEQVIETVKTGEDTFLLAGIIGLMIMSGGGYLFFTKTPNGRILAKKLRNRFTKRPNR